MNITLLTGSISDGGAERVLCNLANYLREKGHTIEILLYSETKGNYYVRPDINVIPLIRKNEKKNRLYNATLCYFRLAKYLRTHKNIDCYVALLPRPIIMVLSLSRLTKAKIIISERNDPLSYSVLWKILLKHYTKRANGIVFQTNEAKNLCSAFIKNCKTVVIPNAINPEFIREPYIGERLKRIVAVGRMTYQKNFELLINAFFKISEVYPEYYLEIFGKGPEQKNLEKQVKQLGIEDRISFHGYVINMPEELEKSTLFIMSSNYEGMPNALMEAMSVGLPCISTDCPCGGPRFLIRNGVNGFLVPVGDKEHMAAIMGYLLANEEERKKIGKKAMEIRERLSFENIYQSWEEFIVNV